MLKRYALGIFSLAIALGAHAQVFTNASAVLSNSSSGAACVGVSDMDGDGLDDIIQLDDSKHVYVLYQNPDHSFVTYDYGVVDNSNQWGWAIADLNNLGATQSTTSTRALVTAARSNPELPRIKYPIQAFTGMALSTRATGIAMAVWLPRMPTTRTSSIYTDAMANSPLLV